jgi:glycosyltransferase involved in cell wall biosynthesis
MKEQITVVIPTYNRSVLLIRCIMALEGQTLSKSDFKVIVVSDGKDEVTEKALLPFLNKDINLTYLCTPVKSGPAAARNLGWRSADTSLIAFTDDDCIPSSQWLESLFNAFSGAEYLALTGKTQVPMPERPSDFAINIAHLETADFITANCACTKNSLLKVDGFDERYKMAWREDSDLEFKFLKSGIPIQSVASAEVIHPVRPAPWGVCVNEQKKGLYDALLFKKFPDLYRNKIQPAPLWNNYLILILTVILVISILFHWDAVIAISSIWLILKFATLSFNRLKRLDKSFSNVMEMLTTSLIIPFLSVYWRWYGAIKYKVFFI